jgi:hypothetical protein
LVEAPDPHGMVLTSTSNIYKVFVNIYMLSGWADGSTIMTLPLYILDGIQLTGSFCQIPGLQVWATNDVMVHWLRPQTHMEWFPLPLQTYKVVKIIHMRSGWADGSTIMTLPQYILDGVQLMEFLPNSWIMQLGYRLYHGALVEAPDPHGKVHRVTFI